MQGATGFPFWLQHWSGLATANCKCLQTLACNLPVYMADLTCMIK
jgi:hypothetical protein